jgi:hypothetical protein
MKTVYTAWRIEPNGAALYCESLPGEKGDYGYTTDADKALKMNAKQAEKFCKYQRDIGRDAQNLAHEVEGTPAYVRQKPRLFFIECTDTFGGEANYSWVTRHIIRASTALGAAHKFGRASGYTWRKDYDSGDMARYNSKSGATCYFLSAYDADQHGQYSSYGTDDRTDAEKESEEKANREALEKLADHLIKRDAE